MSAQTKQIYFVLNRAKVFMDVFLDDVDRLVVCRLMSFRFELQLEVTSRLIHTVAVGNPKSQSQSQSQRDENISPFPFCTLHIVIKNMVHNKRYGSIN